MSSLGGNKLEKKSIWDVMLEFYVSTLTRLAAGSITEISMRETKMKQVFYGTRFQLSNHRSTT